MRPVHLAGAAVAVCCLAAAAAAAPEAEPLAGLSVTHAQFRQETPFTTGIPFPPGRLGAGVAVHLADAGDPGRTYPVQTRPLALWPDGSVRWALVDARVDLAGSAPQRFVLRSGSGPDIDRPLRVDEDADGISIDTGRLRFRVPRGRFAPLEALQLDGRDTGSGPLTLFADIDGRRHEAQAPESLRVLEAGPLRVRLELRGAYGADFHYVLRLDARAGQAAVRVFHTVEHRGARAYANVRQIAVDLALRDDGDASWRAGIDGAEPARGRVEDGAVVLYQEDARLFRIAGAEQAAPAAGWVELRDGAGAVTIASRFFREEFPQGFQLERGRLRYNLRAPEALPAAIGSGVAKTHEFVVAFGTGESAAADLDHLAEPAVAHVDPAWTVGSGALRNAIAPDEGNAAFVAALQEGFRLYRESIDRETWDDGGSLTCSEVAGEHPRQGYYGMLNWGDWNFPWYRDLVNGCETWGNLEYDLTQVLALGFVATGDAGFHRTMTAAARHFMDVDRVHSPAAPFASHGMTHPPVARHFSFERGGPDPGHVWTEGLVSYFHLTGDERARDAIGGIAAWLLRNPPAAGAELKPRQWGWPLIALTAAWEATGDVELRRALRIWARGAMRAWPPTSGRDVGVGTLADGLAYAHAALGNRSLERWLEAYAAAVAAAPPGLVDPRYYPAVAWAAARSGDAAQQAAARDAVARQEFGNWGKPFTLAGRGGFRILSLLP